MTQYFTEEEADNGHAFPAMRIQQVPSCCSAEIISNVCAGVRMSSITTAKPSDIKTVSKLVIPGLKAFEDFSRSGRYTKEGVFAILGLLWAFRILESTNPFHVSPVLRARSPQVRQGRVDSYDWPCKVWSMYDRLDTDKITEVNTKVFAQWLQENADDLGATVFLCEGESVHAKGKGFTAFGSEKPDGYGTIGVWTILVNDVEKLREWYTYEFNQLIKQANFIKVDKQESAISW